MDPERNVKRLRKLFGVSHTILKRAARRPSISEQESEEQQRKRFQILREMRQQRISSIGANQRYVLEICTDMLGLETEEVKMGVVDENLYVDNLNSVFEEKGPMAIMLSNASMVGYPVDSGRYQDKLRHTEVQRTVCLTSGTVRLLGKWMVVYRQQNDKTIDNRTVSDDVALFMINAEGPDSCLNVVKIFVEQIVSLLKLSQILAWQKKNNYKSFFIY